MMEQKNTEWEITITPQAGAEEAHWNDPILVRAVSGPPGLLDLLRGFKELSNVRELKVTFIAGNGYLYYFQHMDGREWLQEIQIAEPITLSAINFSIPDFWQIEELRGRGLLLTKIIQFLLKHPTETIEVEWLM